MAKVKEDLAEVIADSLNSLFKNQKIAYNLSELESPTNVADWVSTGCDTLDLSISNRAYGGLPVGRITEITGLEQSGKSLVSYHILAETQKKGGVAVLIDTETAVDNPFLSAIGVDLTKLVYVSVDTIEEIFQVIEKVISKLREKAPDSLVTIVIDSVAAASTERELLADYQKDGWATDKAIIISKAMRKVTGMIGRQKVALIFTNQLRQKLNAMPFSDPWTTSGGKALSFHSSVRIRLNKAGKLKVKTPSGDQVVGLTVKAHIFKNRMGPPERTCEFDIYFNSGIDNYGSWFNILKKAKLVVQNGAWYTYAIADLTTGEVIRDVKFQSKDLVSLLSTDTELRENMYSVICDHMIMKYIDRDAKSIDEAVIIESDTDDE